MIAAYEADVMVSIELTVSEPTILEPVTLPVTYPSKSSCTSYVPKNGLYKLISTCSPAELPEVSVIVLESVIL